MHATPKSAGQVMTATPVAPSVLVRGLKKCYGRSTVALRDVSFTAYRGEVLGLLGPNGAGKTTTLRIIAGLILHYEGKVEVFGAEWRPGVVPKPGLVSGLIDGSGFLPYLTGRENLSLLLQLAGQSEVGLIDVTERVGATRFIDAPYFTYSHGMRQRLGIAAALITQAPVVLLDEPLEGLDPTAQVSMRSLLIDLASEGKVVILSSHRLAELERICARIVMVRMGETVLEGRLDELAPTSSLVLRVSNSGRAHQALQAAGFQASRGSDDTLMVKVNGQEDTSRVLATLTSGEVEILEFSRQRANLEDLYMRVFSQGE